MGIFDAFKGARDKAESAGEAVKEQLQEQASAGASAPESPVRSSGPAGSKFTEDAASATQAAADRLLADAKGKTDAKSEQGTKSEQDAKSRPDATGKTEPAHAEPEAAAPKPAAAPAAGARTYTVRPGDSLSAIAGRELGDQGRWQELYALNRQTIGADPDLIRPGMELELP
ncbi:LysM peptidoglycan-binding domain-containing protein [Streptomyces indicus]|uniref:LysM domain-containing protein n=1 Tax=Streptomyces indicus TaxID=417292 RepID=A0A1G8UZV7_9ACTN|nr:LysM domain-containing protein [Streptomyces indicus]SDJ59351.1 LysM domain-containing protein [Streptomyces indicus]